MEKSKITFLRKLFGNKGSGKELSSEKKCRVCGQTNLHKVKFCSSCGSEFPVVFDHFDAFISYRRENGSELASLIKVQIENKFHKRIFMDVKELQVGRFDEALLSRIEEAPNFILILSKASLDRCENKSDWLKREIMHALKTERNIIPILVDGFDFPSDYKWTLLPKEMKVLQSLQGIPYSHIHQDSAIRKIASFMTTEAEKLIDKYSMGKTLVGTDTLLNPIKVNLFDFVENEVNEFTALKRRQSNELDELQLNFDPNTAEYIKNRILLLQMQSTELGKKLSNLFVHLNDFKPQSVVDAFAVCDLYLDICLADYSKITDLIWFKSNVNCYLAVSKAAITMQQQLAKLSIVTFTILKNTNVDYYVSSFINTKSSISAESINSTDTFTDDFNINHTTKQRQLNTLQNSLLDRTKIDQAITDGSIKGYLFPLINDYLRLKYELEHAIANSKLTKNYKESDANITKMLLAYDLCSILITNTYCLSREPERFNCMQQILEIQQNFLDCQKSRTS